VERVHEAHLAGLQHTAGNTAVAFGIQRMPRPGGGRCACGGNAGPEGECSACRAKRLAALSVQRAPLEAGRTPAGPATAAWLVEDRQEGLQPGQMPKSVWLEELRAALCARADEELKPTGRSAEGCPVLGFYIGYFAGRPATEIVAAVVRYAPETAGMTSARDVIAPITERVGAAVAVWATTGRITGVPEAFRMGGPPASSPLAAGVQRKARGGEGGGHPDTNPGALLGRLGEGRPLDAGVRTRMEPLFGGDLSDVRVHDGSTAASLSAGLDARAFTVGNHIALGAGEYQPGTIYGDALLAHELAHVVQQRAAAAGAAPVRDGTPAYQAFEHDADIAAAGVVTSLWAGTRAGVANAGPRLRSGLAVQRCSTSVPKCRKRGWSWQVKASYGLGPTCVCAWQCAPGTGGRYANDPSSYSGPSIGQAPPVEWVDEDVVRTYANAHFTPLGAETACGCIPLDVEGDPIPGEQEVQVPLPMRPVGEATDFFPLTTARAIGQLEGRGGARQEPRRDVRAEPKPEAITEPARKQEPPPPPVEPVRVQEPPPPPAAPQRPAKTGDPVVDFQNLNPKINRSQRSTEALTELFNRTASGGRTKTSVPGKYTPVRTRGGSAELEVIVDIAARPEVVSIELIPSAKGSRTPDMVIEVRQADGATTKTRVEITAATGAAKGRQEVGKGTSTETTGVDEIVSAVRRKAKSTPGEPSQLDVPLTGVPVGGILAVVLQRSTSAQAPADVSTAMGLLAAELAGQPHVHTIEFYVPGPKGRAPIRYVRAADGTYTLQTPP
jgi:hypothetical protein